MRFWGFLVGSLVFVFFCLCVYFCVFIFYCFIGYFLGMFSFFRRVRKGKLEEVCLFSFMYVRVWGILEFGVFYGGVVVRRRKDVGSNFI